MNIYEGKANADHCEYDVTKNGEPFSPELSLKVVNHSPTGFSWGYHGIGPSQLGLAILLEGTDEKTALEFYQSFKQKVIAQLPTDRPWKLTSADVRSHLGYIRLDEGR